MSKTDKASREPLNENKGKTFSESNNVASSTIENPKPALNVGGKKIFIINGKWTYNSQSQIVYRENKTEIRLRDKTATVLDLLIENQQELVSTSYFFERIWKGRYVGENVLKQSVKELRHSFQDKNKSLIITIPKKGYKLQGEIIAKTGILNAENSLHSPQPTSFSGAKASSKRYTKKTDSLKSQKTITGAIRSPQAQQHLLNLLGEKKFTTSKLAVFTVTTLIVIVSSFAYWSNNQKALTEKHALKISEVTSTKNFYQDILLRYQSSPYASTEVFKAILKKSIAQIDAYEGSDIEQIGMLHALKELYTITGLYEHSRIILNRIEKLIKALYGNYSEEYFEIRFETINILIKLNNRQEAYNLSQITLEQVKQFQSRNTRLLSRAYYFSGRSNLYCVAPFCKRADSENTGEAHTRTALAMQQQVGEADDIAIGDILWLLNWFVWEGEEKIRISKKALNIYRENYGELHEKTANGLEQLARTLTFWNQEWQQGEEMLLAAYEIRTNLYPQVHPEMARINSYLGEHYFMTGDFNKATRYLQQAIEINISSLGEKNDRNLQDSMLMARALLYSGNAQEANIWLGKAFNMIERNKFTPSETILGALQATRLRVDLSLGNKLAFERINQKMQEAKVNLGSPEFVFTHEYQSQILKYYPEKLSDEYVHALRLAKDNLHVRNRYFYRTDFNYLNKRALALCKNIGADFCTAVKLSFVTEK